MIQRRVGNSNQNDLRKEIHSRTIQHLRTIRPRTRRKMYSYQIIDSALYFSGAKITIACRDLTKAQSAAHEIKRISGNQNVLIRQLDLASLKSVRKFAEEVNKEEQTLDILINNAGNLINYHIYL